MKKKINKKYEYNLHACITDFVNIASVRSGSVEYYDAFYKLGEALKERGL